MIDFVFTCAVCGGPLKRCDGAMRCPASHSYDIASAGYVNLLLSQSSRTHGDDKAMVASRKSFLSRGFYEPISAAVAETCVTLSGFTGGTLTLLDIGCGEGYYTEHVISQLQQHGVDVAAAGIDISRDAIKLAAKSACLAGPQAPVRYAVASAYKLPVAEGYCDIVMSIFAPFPESEVTRVVKQDGFAVFVYPLARHLWELKCLLYDSPLENDPPKQPSQLEHFGSREVEYKIEVSGEDLQNLFFMTPYAYRTPHSAIERLSCAILPNLTVSVGISIYKKSKKSS